MPTYLCIILNRDKGNSYECNVNFPETLDLSKYVCNNEVNKIFYDLYAVISHLGTSSISGHFIAFCRHRINNKWYIYNDNIVSECEEKDYLSGVPYILFYQKMDVA